MSVHVKRKTETHYLLDSACSVCVRACMVWTLRENKETYLLHSWKFVHSPPSLSLSGPFPPLRELERWMQIMWLRNRNFLFSVFLFYRWISVCVRERESKNKVQSKPPPLIVYGIFRDVNDCEFVIGEDSDIRREDTPKTLFVYT